jgi:methyl-accepting chemotaxis protein
LAQLDMVALVHQDVADSPHVVRGNLNLRTTTAEYEPMVALLRSGIVKKTVIGICALAISILGIAGLSWMGLASVDRMMLQILDESRKMQLVKEITECIYDIDLQIWNIIGEKSEERKQERLATIRLKRDEYGKNLTELKATATTSTGRQLLVDLENSVASARNVNNRAIELGLAGKVAEAAVFYAEQGTENMRKVGGAARELVSWRERRMHESKAAATSTSANVRLLILLSSMILLAVFVSAGILLARGIALPILSSVSLMDSISRGDLTSEAPQALCLRKDEAGDLARAMSRLVSALRISFLKAKNIAGTLSATADGLISVSQRLATGASGTSIKAKSVATAAEKASTNTISVAASMEEASINLASVAAATEEMSTTVSDIAANAERARAAGEEAMSQATGVCEQIRKLSLSAQEIGVVTETITNISAQTNLLALNASIEAARAGSAGKGFAVVANEIKDLSQKTAKATEDIKTRISGVQGSTGNAVADVERIADAIRDVGNRITAMATSIEEQATVTKDIAGNIAQATTGVKEANARVSQTASVSSSIAQDVAEVSAEGGAINRDSTNVENTAKMLQGLTEKLKDSSSHFQISKSALDFAAIKKGHVQWRSRLIAMFEGRQELAVENAKDHRQCAFGKWCDSEAACEFFSTPLFKKVASHHEAFHGLAAEIIQKWKGNRRDEAMEGFYKLTPHTDELFSLLDQLSLEALEKPEKGLT